ncbi:MAG: DEAD/DEAH box helicase, partial [Wenzhouxiangellaceae bacterium]
MENHLGELWRLFNFALPGLLGSARDFKQRYRAPIEKHDDGLRMQALRGVVAPFLLRRTKHDAAPELPPVSEIERHVEMQHEQRRLYETVRIAMHDKVRRAIERHGLERSRVVVLDALLRLRQICCDPRLVKGLDPAGKARSAKLELLRQMLPEAVDEGRRILVFSQFTSMLALIEAELTEMGLEYVKLTGRTRDRERPVRRFQAGQIPVFLISLKAGGAGLNLTAADTVIHYDPWWNPAVEDQATGRAHRIGQADQVFSWRLITAGSVEERVMQLQQNKRQLIEGLFARGNTTTVDTQALEALFAPLDDQP